MRQKIVPVLFFCLLWSACLTSAQEKSVASITHYNLVIVPDLSNRLNRACGPSDVAIIRAVLNDIYPKIANYKRVMFQKDMYRVVLSSSKLGGIYHADFSRMSILLHTFPDQQKRIDYLKGRGAGIKLPDAVAAFIAEFARIETEARKKPYGADIWSFFSGVDANLVGVNQRIQTGNKTVCNQYRNLLVIFTDGYIEAGISGQQGCIGKQCRYLSQELIGKFRKDYQKHSQKNETLQAFFARNGYGIIPVSNPYLKNFDVLLLEADDRSLKPTGNATVFPADYEIMQLFWADWMKKSGVQRFEMHPLARDAQEAEQNILSFMGIR